MHVGAVTLDAAGTLFEPVEPVGVTYARVARRHGFVVADDAVEQAFRDALSAAPPLAFPDASPAEVADRERAWWSRVVRRALGVEATPAFEACFAELYEHFATAAAWRLFPEVVDALGALRGRGLRLAIVSNFDSRLERVVAGLGLAPLVDAVVTSSQVGAAKPAPAIFHAALVELGVAPRTTVHAGDGVVADVAGARAAGLRAVLVDRAATRPRVPPGTITVTTLSELPATVDGMTVSP